ncbi:kinase-like protein [Hypoxylon trugodes]|uniref:kinase-like protein n=1 Tax=Hypoxylon trugodes TaxID=326681 RepID=UPI002193CF47|nr:kinase-like protein [Hypoxylon trugodes]KAI1387836.1 kinase-like protein [Hypoxylon trugodes]
MGSNPPAEGYKSCHHHCHDRGEGFRQNVILSNRTIMNQPSLGTSESLYDALWNARVSYTNNENHCFIPFDELQLARNPDLVKIALQNDGVPQSEVPELLSRICAPYPPKCGISYFRIFAILVLCENAGCIKRFVDQGVDDSYLPLPAVKRNGDKFSFSRHTNGPKINDDRLLALFQDHNKWRSLTLNQFNTCQWWAIAPFFDQPDAVIPHYVLESNDILPLTEKKSHLELEIKSLDPDVQEVVLRGGFGDVFIVKMHRSHYHFRNQPYSDGSHSFALKRLKSPNANEFQLEVDALRKYSYGIDKHLIPLLATIEKDDDAGKYYLLFPKANGDLRHLWKTQFMANPDNATVRWMAEQCLGIAKALSMLHQDQDKYKDEGYPIYGRHGDIKAGNILWFSKPGNPGPTGWRLVLSDFGLMRFHRAVSISVQTASKLKKTLTYQAPEFDIAGAKVSRKSDIWALGCTYLEFVTCCISGPQAVETEFPSCRGESDTKLHGVSEDKFYHTIGDGSGAELKPGVRSWISNLRRDPRCSQYFYEFLTFIEDKMLCIERDKRPAAAEVVKSLDALSTKCRNDSYLKKGYFPTNNGVQ